MPHTENQAPKDSARLSQHNSRKDACNGGLEFTFAFTQFKEKSCNNQGTSNKSSAKAAKRPGVKL